MTLSKKALHIILIGMLMSVLTVSNDLVLPAFPSLREGLFMTTQQVELTLTTLLLGFGISQLFWGPFADQYGRRLVLLTGLGIYTLASLQCALTHDIQVLTLSRILQGIGMGAAVVCGRALVRDVFTPAEAPRAFTLSLSIVGLFSALAPFLGSQLVHWFPWHTWHVSYIALFVFAWLCWAFVAWGYKETLPVEGRASLEPQLLLARVLDILKHRAFQRLSLVLSAGFASLFTYLASSPFIFIEHFGLGERLFGGLVAMTAAAYFSATFCCHALLKHFPAHVTMGIGVSLSVLSSFMMLLFAAGVFGEPTWPMILACCMGLTFAHGIHQPCAQAGLVGPFPRSAGTAAALGGSFNAIAAYIAGIFLGLYLDHSLFELSLLFCFWSTLLAAPVWLYWFMRYRRDQALLQSATP